MLPTAVAAVLALLLAIGCGTQRARDHVETASIAVAPTVTDVSSATSVGVVAGASVAPFPADGADQVREACGLRVYEVLLGATATDRVGAARVTRCLVLDLGDLSIRAVDVSAP
jgi:hypothetical protein